MKKLFSLLLVVMLLCAAMTGCFTSTNPTEPEEPIGGAEKTTSVKITDTFSAEDPEGLAYETRHVYAGDKNSTAIIGMAAQGYNASAMYAAMGALSEETVNAYLTFVSTSNGLIKQ